MNVMKIYSEKQVNTTDLLQIGSESKLLEVLDQANLSDSELDEIPFGVSTTFSRFFDANLLETDKGIYFVCNEVGGCFCEPAYILELNSFPEEKVIQEISAILRKLDRIGVDNLKGTLSCIFHKLDVKKALVNEFQREELEDRLIYELRTNIREAIDNAICDFRDKNLSNLVEQDLERIIKDIQREFN